MIEKRRKMLLGYLFVSPWVIGLGVFIIYPLIYNIYLCFNEYNGFGEPFWIGWDNYVRMFTQDDVFWKSVSNTLIYT